MKYSNLNKVICALTVGVLIALNPITVSANSVVAVPADEPGPTPVPAPFLPRYEQELINPELGATLAGENYSSIAVLTQPAWQPWKYSYHCKMSAQGTNSLQIWCDARYRGRYGSTWYVVNDLWDSTWGTSLGVGGVADMSGQVVVWTRGTHLFDYGPNNWVWCYSEDYDNNWL
jgi:hypothetical protein